MDCHSFRMNNIFAIEFGNRSPESRFEEIMTKVVKHVCMVKQLPNTNKNYLWLQRNKLNSLCSRFGENPLFHIPLKLSEKLFTLSAIA